MIYLDHAAATPVNPQVFAAMQKYFSTDFFNPSAAYLPAKKVRSEYEAAKDDIAHAIGAKGVDLVITAGATEANNLAFGVMENNFGIENFTPECLISSTEHDSIQNVAHKYHYQTVNVDKFGTLDLADLIQKITDRTVLISVALADNELGTIQPMSKISAIIKDVILKRRQQHNFLPLFLHSDASQAEGLVDISVARMGIDLLTLNSGKIYGPKGVGALYLSHSVKIQPKTLGGGQERGLRSGTENVAGVIGFAAAMTRAKDHRSTARKNYLKFRQIFLENFTANLKQTDFYLLGQTKNQLANFLPLSIPGVDAERLIFLLEEQEIYLSTGAACAASKGQKSRTLEAIGLGPEEINGQLRITFGETNTVEAVGAAGKIIAEVINQEILRMKNEQKFYRNREGAA